MRTKIQTAMTALAMLAVVLGEQTRAADIKQQPWRRLKEIKSEAEMQELPGNATIAMSCSKCKSVSIVTKRDLVTGRPGHGTKEVTTVVHQCPGCGGEITRKPGTKETTWVHTCSKCGDDSAYCCATYESDKPTSGMDSDKKR